MRRLVLEQPLSRAAIWAVRTVLFAIVVLVYSIVLIRGGQHGAPGFAALGSALALILAVLVLCAAGSYTIWTRGLKGFGRILFAALTAAALLAPGVWLGVRYVALPKLNDISTDIDDPPSFSRSRAALAARANHVPMERERAARLPQRDAYQRIIPIISDLRPEEAYEVAARAALAQGWQIIERSAPGGRTGTARIEAVATTRLMRFKDDVTIRVRPRVDGARIDIRSASRLGAHDFGANAERIQAFADGFQLLSSAR
jgi:uncharacterized protein (DUF1499 family)